jgi:signal transduction histidine kinase
MLDGATTSEEEFRDSARIINDEANRMRALVDDLLLISQIESGQVAMEHAHVDIKALLQRMVERFQWTMRSSGIECGQSLDQLPLVHGDERRLEQVFSNLIDNAIRHTPQGGRISVSASVLRGGEVEVTVHNTGSTIPPEDLPRVFERFFQVDRARARRGGSSGLGLSIVSEIVEAHRGTVRAVSDPERGTEFIVTLPSAAALGGRNGRAPAPADKQRPRPTKRGAPA